MDNVCSHVFMVPYRCIILVSTMYHHLLLSMRCLVSRVVCYMRTQARLAAASPATGTAYSAALK
jgi:hypothetical protein